MNNLIKKMAGGKLAIGPFVSVPTTEKIEMLGLAGFDFCIVDGEHGPANYAMLQYACVAGDVKDIDISVIYRVPENTEAAIGHALDLGAGGVLVPHVSDAASAQKSVNAAKFYPIGERGVHGGVRAARFGHRDLAEYMNKSNEETMLMIQIEGIEGVNNLDSILEIDGYDGIFIGPYDLSQSLGVPGEVNSQIVQDKMKEIVNKVKSKNKNIYLGAFFTDMESVKKWSDLGIQFIAYQIDTMFFLAGANTAMDDWKKCILSK
jgi:4-hydroxy-2-oxoheptanedioate aldolase